MDDFEVLKKKIADLQFEHKELVRKLPKLKLQVEAKELEVRTLNRQTVNVMADMERATEKIRDLKVQFNAEAKERTDAIEVSEAKWEKEYTTSLYILEQRELEADRRNDELDSQQNELDVRYEEADDRETDVSLRETDTEKREKNVEATEGELNNRKNTLKLAEEELNKREKAINVRGTTLEPRLLEVDELYQSVAKDRTEAQGILEKVQEANAVIEMREKVVSQRERKANTKEKELDEKSEEIAKRQEQLRKHLGL